MILAQDEMTIQRMLGCDQVPEEVHDEYLKRARFLHRETSGGPMGPGMVVDMLRYLGYEPAVSGSDNPAMVDWREVERGTRVRVRRAGRWTATDVVCRFEGFVDMGTLAVELPSGCVDEFNKYDVKIWVEQDSNKLGVVSNDDKQAGTMLDGTAEPDVRADLDSQEGQSQDETDATDATDDTVSYPLGDEGDTQELEELDAGSPELAGPGSPWPPAPDWKLVKELDAVWVRERIGEGRDMEIDIHDAKFLCRLPGGKIKVKMVVGEGDELEEVNRVFQQDDVRLPVF